MTEALVVKPEYNGDKFGLTDLSDSIDDEYINTEIIDLCGSLVEVQAADYEQLLGSRAVHLIHVSVKEYLLSVLPSYKGYASAIVSFSDQTAHNLELSKVCIRYLKYKTAWEHTISENGETHQRPLVEYAARSWFLYMDTVSPEDYDLTRLINEFFQPGNHDFNSWRRQFEPLSVQILSFELRPDT